MPVDELELLDVATYVPEDPSGWATKLKNDLAKLKLVMPWFNVLDFGAVDGGPGVSAAANKVAFQACLDAIHATTYGGVMYAPGGWYDVGDWKFLYPSDGLRHYGFVGDGMNVTTIQRSTDGVAEDKFIGPILEDQEYARCKTHIHQMTLYGPSTGTFTYGTSPAFMDGVEVNTRMVLDNVEIKGFRAGTVNRGNHIEYRHCEFANNYYGVHFKKVMQASDMLFDNCIFRANAYAGLAVAGGQENFIGGTLFDKCWLGSQPYGIYGETETTATTTLVNVVFNQTSWENHSNGAIYVEGQKGTLQNIDFIQNRVFSIGTQAQLPSTTGCPNVIAAENMGAIRLSQTIMSGFGNTPTNAYINAITWNVGSLIWWDWFGTFSAAQTAGVALVCGTTASFHSLHLLGSSGYDVVRLRPAVGTIEAGDLVTNTNYTAVSRPTGYTVIEGVALNTPTKTSEMILVATKGDRVSVKTNAGSVNFSNVIVQDSVDFYKAAPIAMTAAVATRPVIGRATGTATLAGTMLIRLQT